MPPNVVRRSPTRLATAMIDPTTPAIATRLFQLLRRSGRKRSTKSTSNSALVRMISGSAACRSMEFMSGEEPGQAADGGVGDVEDERRVDAQRDDPGEQRRPRRQLDRMDVLEPFAEALLGGFPEVEPLQ